MVLHVNYEVILVEKIQSYIIRRQYAVQLWIISGNQMIYDKFTLLVRPKI
jgi:hypothetical protein